MIGVDGTDDGWGDEDSGNQAHRCLYMARFHTEDGGLQVFVDAVGTGRHRTEQRANKARKCMPPFHYLIRALP